MNSAILKTPSADSSGLLLANTDNLPRADIISRFNGGVCTGPALSHAGEAVKLSCPRGTANDAEQELPQLILSQQ